MTVATTQTAEEWTGDASSATFPIPFPFLSRDHLVVWKEDALGVQTAMTISSATGEGESTGGSVTLTEAVGTGYTLHIRRQTPKTQETDYVPHDPFPADSHERALDKLTMIVQELIASGVFGVDSLRILLGDSTEIAWTVEGGKMLGELVWPLRPPIGDYIDAPGSMYQSATGGHGYGSDTLTAKASDGSDTRHGLELAHSGSAGTARVGNLDGTRLEYAQNVGGEGVHARGVGAHAFDGLIAGELADAEADSIRPATIGVGGRIGTASPADFRDAIDAVNIAGDTMTGGLTLTSLVNSATAGVGIRPKVALADGTDAVQDAATFRGTIGAVAASEKGAANGVAPLGADSKIASTYLPSYVDDVLEFAGLASFPATGESGKIYVTLDTNKTYRWSGSAYVEISASLALGETSSTAYRGDRGKTAYDHSQITAANPHGTTFAQLASKPATLSGYGITDAQPLDSDLTAIAALSTQAFGRSLLTQADAAAVRRAIGASDGKELLNWYTPATRPADCDLEPDGLGGLRRFLAVAGTANGPSTAQTSHVLHIGHDGANGYDTQLASEATTGALRSRAQTAGVWGAWNTVWDSVNLPASAIGKTLLNAADAAAARSLIGAASVSSTGTLIYSDFGKTPSGESSGTSAFADNTSANLQLAANSIVSGTRMIIEQLVDFADVSKYRLYQLSIGPLIAEDGLAVSPQYFDLLMSSDTTQWGYGRIVTDIEFIGAGASVIAHVTCSILLGSGSTKTALVRCGKIAVDNTRLRYIDIRFKPVDSTGAVIRRNRIFKLNP